MIWYTILLVISTIIIYYTLKILGECGRKYEATDYASLVK